MELSPEQQKNLDAIRKTYEDNEMFQRPDRVVGKLLDIIDTLLPPLDDAPAPDARADTAFEWRSYPTPIERKRGDWEPVKCSVCSSTNHIAVVTNYGLLRTCNNCKHEWRVYA